MRTFYPKKLLADRWPRHYEDCYNALADLFGSTAALPPRTKRWAEAKVLADCISMKVKLTVLVYG